MKSGANTVPLGEVKRGGGSLMAQRSGGGPAGRGEGNGGQRGRGSSRGRGAGRGRSHGGRGRGGGCPQRRGSPSTTKSEMEKRRKTQILEKIKKDFENLQLEFGDPHMDPKRDPGTVGEAIAVKTNVFGIKMNEDRSFLRYDVTISAKLKKKKGSKEPSSLELTKRTKDDTVVVNRRKYCAAAFECFFAKFPKVFGTVRAKLIYDMQCILFTPTESPLEFGELGNADNSEGRMILGLEDLKDCDQKNDLREFKLIIMLLRKVNKIVEFSSLSLLTNDMTKQNHTLPQFLELAVTQHPLNAPADHVILGHTSYLLHPEEFGFEPNDGPVLSKDNKYLGIGVHKAVRYVEGPTGKGGKKVGLVVESKKTPFHNTDANLLYKAASVVGPNSINQDGSIRTNAIPELNQQFKNLFVEIRYPNGRSREIRLSGVTPKTAHTHTVEIKLPRDAPRTECARRITVEQYFLERYEHKLEFPNAPMATASEGGQINYYPMELLWPMDNQRIQLSQLSARETAAMIRAAAVPPDQLKRQIDRSLNVLNVNESPFLEEAGIKIMRALTAKARHLPPPIIVGGNSESGVDKGTGKFQIRDSFFMPAVIEKWAIYLIRGGGRNELKFEKPQMEGFIRVFMNTCRSYGMTISNPESVGELEAVEGQILKELKLMCDYECDFAFFITSDGVTNMHDIIKRGEREYHVVTQDLKLSNAVEIVTKGKQETMQNIVYKTNEKVGGINYSLRLVDNSIQEIAQETLFIGLGTSHAGAMGNYERARGAVPALPSVIGFAANMKKDPFDFVGDFIYDEPRRDEKFNTLAMITEVCVKRFDDSRGCVPKRLILFRNGQAEGQYANSLQYEIPLIRHALEMCGAKECKLTVLTTQKMHSIRLFAEPMDLERSAQSGRHVNLNIKPGTVVDQQLTHPEHNEFYLNSHTAIQGTTRAPRYITLCDDNEFSADQIQQMVYALAYGYKIINSPTSLPAPIYIAMMYAKRGRALYKVMREDPEFMNMMRHEDGQINYEELYLALGYNTAQFLRNKRVNA